MKRLLLISQKHSIFTEPIRKSFIQLGWEVDFIDYWGTPLLMPYTAIHRLFERLPKIIHDPIRKKQLEKIDSHIEQCVSELKPALIFVSKGKNINLDLLDRLRTKSVVVNWYPETMDHWERISRTASHYSHFFSFDPMVVSELIKSGYPNAHYLPFCADIPKDAVYPAKKYKYDVSFIGSYEKIRYRERELILSKIKDLGLNIWGNGAWRYTSLRSYYHSYASREEIRQIHQNSKIVLGMHVFGIGGTGVNVRPFDTTGDGGFLLNHDERKDIFNLFEDGKEFVSFHGADDIRQKVQYYLSHDEERERIARAGFERTKQHHTYMDRIKEVLNMVNL